MRFAGILAIALMAVCVGCGSTDPMKMRPTIIAKVDFNYNTTWSAAVGAVQVHFPYLEYCNKDDMKVISYFRREPVYDITAPREWAERAFVTIIPVEAPEGTAYDIEVRVGKYWRAVNPWQEDEENWELVSWDRIKEKNIVDSFHKQTVFDQRVRQGHDRFDKRRKSGF